MDKPKQNNINSLHKMAQFALFTTSYTPLFILIIIRQAFANQKNLHWAGFTKDNLCVFASNFGLSSLLILLSVFGVLGFWLTFRNIKNVAQNGFPVTVKNISNKNSEAIGYIATYIIPFLFQKFDNWDEGLSVLFLLIVIFHIYVNSSLLLVNPLLSFRYAIYEIEFENKGINKKGLIISKDKYLLEEASIKLYEIGYKLYFAINND